MGIFSRLKYRNDTKVLLENAELAVASVVEVRSRITRQKVDLSERQAELWMLGTLSSGLEDEYLRVSRDIQEISTKLFVVDAFSRELLNARSDCISTGNCGKLVFVPDVHPFLSSDFLKNVSISQPMPAFLKEGKLRG